MCIKVIIVVEFLSKSSTFASFSICNWATCTFLFYRSRKNSVVSIQYQREIVSLFPATFLFYALNTIGIISFLNLSLYWPELMRHWQTIESLPIFRNYAHKAAYVRSIRLLSATALFLALGNSFKAFMVSIQVVLLTFLISIAVEYGLFISVSIKYNKYVAVSLQGTPILNYKSIIVCYLSVKAAFVWSFLDILIMIVGIGLTTHFKALNNELQQTKLEMEVKSSYWRLVCYELQIFVLFLIFQNLPTDYWMKIRMQYTKLCNLVAIVDDKISHLILLSFSNNLFMICQQLFESLRWLLFE